MKLCEAIVLGSVLKPQAFGTWSDARGSCALGAAMDAMGKDVLPYEILWPFTESLHSRCPQCKAVYGPVGAVIIHLNDVHRWHRERIADWVATVEPKQEQEDVGRDQSTRGSEPEWRPWPGSADRSSGGDGDRGTEADPDPNQAALF